MFEDYLKEVHAEHFASTDEPGEFEKWLENLETEDLLFYGNKAMRDLAEKVEEPF